MPDREPLHRPDPRASAAALERMSLLALREHSMQSLLQAVADSATTVLPGASETSVFVQTGRQQVTVVSSGQLAVDLDEVQYSRGEGPCLQAASTRTVVEVHDTRTEQRWPAYARRAAEYGNRSSLSVPLLIDERRSGAMNIYAQEPDAFDEAARSVAIRFAPYAAVAIANMHAVDDARLTAGNLQTALESRAVIDQAKGILMERHQLTADQAFQTLAQASMASQRKVRDIADHLVTTGDLPAPPVRH